jgi:hypothetical protein
MQDAGMATAENPHAPDRDPLYHELPIFDDPLLDS